MRYFKITLLPILLGTFATLSFLIGFAHASIQVATPKIVPTILYVDADANGEATGLFWTDAYTTLQDALTIAISDTQIWVAEGVYYPDEGSAQLNDSETSRFVLTNEVSIYGGFDPSSDIDEFNERDWDTYITVLSGDIDQNDISDPNGVVTNTANITGTNAYHVVFSASLTRTAVLDGFTITAGNAAGGGHPDDLGGGIYNYFSNPTLVNVIFSGNSADAFGGGMYNGGIPLLTNVNFSRNSAGDSGGGMFNSGSDLSMTNVTFSGNSSGSGNGGGICNIVSSPILANVTFSGNMAGGYGGGLYNGLNSNPMLTNVTFSGNSASHGGGIFNSTGNNPVLINVIIWGNTATYGSQIFNAASQPPISYSNIQGSGGSTSWDTSLGTDGGGNIDIDPLFLRNPNSGDGDWSTLEDNDYGDLHLEVRSPAINAGTNTGCPLFDLDGQVRPIGILCDMGAYESEYGYIFYFPFMLK